MDNLPFLKERKYFCKSVHVSSAYPLSSHIPRAGNMLFSAYYKYIIIRNREYLFLCDSNHRFYENFQNIKKEPFPDSSSNLNLNSNFAGKNPLHPLKVQAL